MDAGPGADDSKVKDEAPKPKGSKDDADPVPHAAPIDLAKAEAEAARTVSVNSTGSGTSAVSATSALSKPESVFSSVSTLSKTKPEKKDY